MIRIVFSLAALLVALFIVYKLSATQLDALKPPPAATPSVGGAPAPANAAQATAAKVQQAIEAGAAARASDADAALR